MICDICELWDYTTILFWTLFQAWTILGISKIKDQTTEAVAQMYYVKNVLKFTGEQMWESLYFNKVTWLRPRFYLKSDSGTGVFLWILQKF